MTLVFTPLPKDQQQLKELATHLSQADGHMELLLSRGDVTRRVTLTPLLAQLLQASVRELGDGHTLELVTTDAEVTPSRAARFLGISRPHLVNALLRTGQLPYRMVGRHHRIAMTDLLAYRRARDDQHEAADSLTQWSEELDLYGSGLEHPEE